MLTSLLHLLFAPTFWAFRLGDDPALRAEGMMTPEAWAPYIIGGTILLALVALAASQEDRLEAYVGSTLIAGIAGLFLWMLFPVLVAALNGAAVLSVPVGAAYLVGARQKLTTQRAARKEARRLLKLEQAQLKEAEVERILAELRAEATPTQPAR